MEPLGLHDFFKNFDIMQVKLHVQILYNNNNNNNIKNVLQQKIKPESFSFGACWTIFIFHLLLLFK